MRGTTIHLFTLVLALALARPASAAVPGGIHVQGQLTDPAGTPLPAGDKTLSFSIHDAESLGNKVWPAAGTEDQVVTTGSDGQWAAFLGAIESLTHAVFADSARWLEITVNDGVNPAETLPRIRLVTGPYAHRVATVDGASGGWITSKTAIGPNHDISGPHAFAAGDGNTVSGEYATVPGGTQNAAGGSSASVGGGYLNLAYGAGSTISGGIQNQIPDSAVGATVGGGSLNGAMHTGATVAGGDYNGATGSYSTVGGGRFNQATGSGATVGGGFFNDATEYAAYASGSGSQATAPYATVAGGQDNEATDSAATVGGGQNNFARGHHSVIAGGGGADADSNAASGSFAVISGGARNVASGARSVIGGGVGNTASNNFATVAGGWAHSATNEFSTVGGGFDNNADGLAATASGGRWNLAAARYTGIGGGIANEATADGAYIGGGGRNNARGVYSFVGGGGSNSEADSNTASGLVSVVVGGRSNYATASYATVPGGLGNVASGDYSFAAGRRAKATHRGSFVWGSSINDDVVSGAPNQFVAHASGGVVFYTDSAQSTGVVLLTGAGAWGIVSDSTVKENIRPIDATDLLDKIAQLEISRWNYRAQGSSIEHIGPMAQDFYRLFGLGGSDRTISTVDPDGIALAAIKELDRRTKRIAELEASLAQQQAQIVELRAMVEALSAQK